VEKNTIIRGVAVGELDGTVGLGPFAGVESSSGNEELAFTQPPDADATFTQQPLDLRLLLKVKPARSPPLRSSVPVATRPRRPRRFVELDVADPDADAALGDAELRNDLVDRPRLRP
jgi:hypothetical protein